MRLQDDMQTAKTVPWPTAALNVLRKISGPNDSKSDITLRHDPQHRPQDSQRQTELLTLKTIVAICSAAWENVYRQGPWMIAKVEVGSLK